LPISRLGQSRPDEVIGVEAASHSTPEITVGVQSAMGHEAANAVTVDANEKVVTAVAILREIWAVELHPRSSVVAPISPPRRPVRGSFHLGATPLRDNACKIKTRQTIRLAFSFLCQAVAFFGRCAVFVGGRRGCTLPAYTLEDYRTARRPWQRLT
jgi:hypothetical protein